MLLAQLRAVRLVRRVVGVGSVGTRCYLVALQDGDDHALMLQAKEANRSVLIEYGGAAQPPELTELIEQDGEGGRVVALQRILQAVSDPFLGHLRAARSRYVRPSVPRHEGRRRHRDPRGRALLPLRAGVRGHARPRARAISERRDVAGYIGNGRVIGEALLEWAYAYAQVSLADYENFVAAHRAG